MSALRMIIVGFLAVGIVSAAERVHVVAPGESAAGLAKKYYGDKDLDDLLLRFNGKTGTMIHPGEKLTIPSCTIYRAKAGDTWSVLAKRHLGRAGAAPVLAELNGFSAGQPLRVGSRIVMPVVLHHTLAKGETLSVLADRYYGDSRKAAIVQEFSRIDDVKRLAVGTALEIPVIAFVRVETAKKPQPAIAAQAPAKPVEKAAAPVEKPAAPVEKAAAPVEKPAVPVETPAPAAAPEPAVPVTVAVAPPAPPAPHQEPPKFETPLAAAAKSFFDGDYDHARQTLEALRDLVAREGTVSDRREWARLMAFVYVALDRDGDACSAYRSSPAPDPPANLDPDVVSPRIRSVLAGCTPAPA